MKLTPIQFLNAISTGKSEKELNRTESREINKYELKKLTSKKYGLTYAEATDHLLTDYSDGFTICAKCGSYYHLGTGFTKHLSNGCLHCEGGGKHHTYYVNASKPKDGGFPARWMSQMFDDGMHYCKDNLQIEALNQYVNAKTLAPIK